jgi:hypothetical protein
MTCETDRCRAVMTFVKPLLGDHPATSWTVSDEPNSVQVSISIGLPDSAKIKRVTVGDRELDDATKQSIEAWLKENL